MSDMTGFHQLMWRCIVSSTICQRYLTKRWKTYLSFFGNALIGSNSLASAWITFEKTLRQWVRMLSFHRSRTIRNWPVLIIQDDNCKWMCAHGLDLALSRWILRT